MSESLIQQYYVREDSCLAVNLFY